MRKVTIHEAKTHLSRLLKLVEAGEEVVIARGKTEIAKLVPVEQPQRCFGAMHGQFETGTAFFDPLPEAELDV
jgi:prevent-host-death family protein